MIDCCVILPAAGKGQRFAAAGRASANKVEHELEGRAVFLGTIDLFHGRPEVRQIVLAVDPARIDEFRFRWGEALSFLEVEVVAGGETDRWETVANALRHVSSEVTHIAVHDAARPATPKAVIDRVFAAAEQHEAVIPGLPVSNTLKRLGESAVSGLGDRVDDILGLSDSDAAASRGVLGVVADTVPRHGLVEVQTPQVFRADLLRRAYESVGSDGTVVTDDAALVEALGVPVTVVEGDPGNLKLTRSADAELLSALLRFREAEAAQANAVRELFGDDDE